MEQSTALEAVSITEQEFGQFQKFLYQMAGIKLSSGKKALVCSRLGKRLKQFGLDSYGAYYKLLESGKAPNEVQIAVDLLTTNETFFFRERKHFDFLAQEILPRANPYQRPFRVWSAASSTGEEAYTTAMILSDHLGEKPWEIVASDISTKVLERARKGHYPLEKADKIPADYLKRYCLKGVGSQEGTFMIKPVLRSRVIFRHINLNNALPDLGEFDVIFLRNVMIYFEAATKRQVIGRILSHLRIGGYLMVGHSESLNGISDALLSVMPSLYRKPQRPKA